MQLIRKAATRAPGTRPARRVVSAMLLSLAVAACGTNGRADPDPNASAEEVMTRSIEDVLEARTAELMRIDGVEGAGIGLCDETPCIRLYLRSADVASRVPKELDGYPVSTVVTGTVRIGTID